MLALGFAVGAASAQCPVYQHPAKARGFSSSLVQAFMPCYGSVTISAGGVPACQPVETFTEMAGSPSGGWLWGKNSSGTATVKASKKKVVNVLNNPATTADLVVTLRMVGIEDENGIADGSGGTLSTVARATLNDSTVGLATVIDFPAGFPIAAAHGKINVKTSANILLNGLGLPGLASCSSIEVVSIQVLDPNGNPFGVMGTYLPHP